MMDRGGHHMMGRVHYMMDRVHHIMDRLYYVMNNFGKKVTAKVLFTADMQSQAVVIPKF